MWRAGVTITLALLLASGCGRDASDGVRPPPVAPPASIVVEPPPAEPEPEALLPELVIRGRWLPAASGRLLLASAIVGGDDAVRAVVAQGTPSASDGSFEIVLRGEALAGPGRVELREATRDGAPGDRVVVAFREALTGRLDFGKMGEGGAPRLLVAGVVERLDGPVERQREYVDGEWEWRESSERRRVPNATVRVLADALGREFEIARSVADADGVFRVPGIVEGADGLSIEAAGAWTHAARSAFERGDGDVAVEVAVTCRISGELAPGHGFDVDDLEVCVHSELLGEGMPDGVSVIPSKGWSYADATLSFPLRDPGAFTLCGLAPGTYHVTLRMAGSHDVIQQLNDVEVSGLETVLPILAADREAAHTTVSVICPDSLTDEDADGVRAWVRPVSGRGAFREVDVEDGVAEIQGTGRLLDVVVHAPGCGYTTVQTENEDVQVTLEPVPAASVEVPLPDDLIRKRAGVEIVLTVRWSEPLEGERFGEADSISPFDKGAVADPRDLEEFEIPFPTEGPVRFELTEPGVYRLGYLVRVGNNTSSFQGASSVRADGSGTAIRARRPFAAASVNRRVEKAAKDL